MRYVLLTAVMVVALAGVSQADTIIGFDGAFYPGGSLYQDGWVNPYVGAAPYDLVANASAPALPPGGNGTKVVEHITTGASNSAANRALGPEGGAGTESYASGPVYMSLEYYYTGASAGTSLFQINMFESANFVGSLMVSNGWATWGQSLVLEGSGGVATAAITGSPRWIEIWAKQTAVGGLEAGWVEAGGTLFGTPMVTRTAVNPGLSDLNVVVHAGGGVGVGHYFDDLFVSNVPEPVTVVLLALGGALAALKRRRR